MKKAWHSVCHLENEVNNEFSKKHFTISAGDLRAVLLFHEIKFKLHIRIGIYGSNHSMFLNYFTVIVN